jgi:hypothetical protein
MLSRPQGHGAAGGIKSIKSIHEPIGNRTRNLPDHSAVPQPTPPSPSPRTASKIKYKEFFEFLDIPIFKKFTNENDEEM